MALTSDYLSIFAEMFDTSFDTVYQANGKLRNVCRRQFRNVNYNSLSVPRGGVANMRPLTSYQSDIPSQDISVDNINVTFTPKQVKHTIGEFEAPNFRPDAIPMLAEDHALAVSRFEDNIIINALTDGKSATIADSGTNMNVAKLVEARTKLGINNVTGNLYLLMHWSQMQSMLGQLEYTDSSFNAEKTLVDPAAQKAAFAGFNIITYGDVLDGTTNIGLPKTGDIRSCYAFSDSSVILAYQKEVATRVVPVPNQLRMEVITAASIGAKAFDGSGIIEIKCDETA